MTPLILYTLYAFVQGAIIVRCSTTRKEIMEHGGGGEIILYILFAPLFTILFVAYGFALFIRWLLVVGKP